MYCCPNCFSDNFLQNHIAAISNKSGKCDFCKSTNITLLNPEELFDRFEPLIDIYEEYPNGYPLMDLLQLDWNVFGLPGFRSQQKLLKAVTKSECSATLKYKAKFLQDKKNIEQWKGFREELMHKNRFLPNDAPDKAHIEVLSRRYLGVTVKKGSQTFFRARINNSDKAFSIKMMGKPPKKKVGNGRANPIGIPYLYVASTIKTAISEIRGHKGERVTVAEYNLIRDLELVDLRNPKNKISPFELNDENELKLIYTNMPFLKRLGKELSQPIIPSKANLEYLPSQYLSEMFKQIGFHGIIYKSSIEDGNNYVIFAEKKLKPIQTHQYRISDTNISIDRI